MLRFALVTLTLFSAPALAQDQPNPTLAAGPWAFGHRGAAQQASTEVAGPDGPAVADARVYRDDAGTAFGTSPFHAITEAQDGRRVLWGTSLTHAFKYVIDGPRFTFAGAFPLTRVASVSWNLMAIGGGRLVVPQPRGLRQGRDCRSREPSLVVLTDDGDPDGPIRCAGMLELSDDVVRAACGVPRGWRIGYSAYALQASFTGEIATTATYVERGSFGGTKRSYLILADNALNRVVACAEIGAGSTSNQFPVEQISATVSAFYIATETLLVRLDYDAATGRFARVWEQRIGFRSRTGTTPTLVGFGADRFVVMIDSVCAVTGVFTGNIECEDGTGPSAMVAARRETGQVTRVPLPEMIRTVENSPSAAGLQMVVADYPGYRPDPEARGVVSMEFDPAAQAWQLAWATDAVQMSGVTTISTGSNMVYSSGVDADGMVRMRGIRLSGPGAGEVVFEVFVGPGDDFMDPGSNTLIDADGSLIYGALKGVVRVRPLR